MVKVSILFDSWRLITILVRNITVPKIGQKLNLSITQIIGHCYQQLLLCRITGVTEAGNRCDRHAATVTICSY